MESKTDRPSHEHSGALGGKVARSLRPGGEHGQRAVNMSHSQLGGFCVLLSTECHSLEISSRLNSEHYP